MKHRVASFVFIFFLFLLSIEYQFINIFIKSSSIFDISINYVFIAPTNTEIDTTGKQPKISEETTHRDVRFKRHRNVEEKTE